MKAAVITLEQGRKSLVTQDVPDPEYGDEDVLVRVADVGICGSDLHAFLDPADVSRPPGMVMGHEPSGVVAAVGRKVTGVLVGQRVTVDPQVVCGTCYPCSQGWISICDNKGVIGSGRSKRPGAMAELLAVPARQVVPVPDNLTLAEAAMIEPLANAVHVVNRSELRAGETAVVLGAGPIGLCLVQCLCLAGAGTVIVTDIAESRRRVASRLGASVALDPNTDDVQDAVMALTQGRGADVVVESVGIDRTYQQALEVVRKRGRVMFFGAIQPLVTLNLLQILWKEITIIGCTGANGETAEAIEKVASGSVRVDEIITHQFGLNDAQRAIATLSDPDSGAIKVLVGEGEANAGTGGLGR